MDAGAGRVARSAPPEKGCVYATDRARGSAAERRPRVIGRRVLLAAPALVPVAALVPREAGAQIRRNDLDALALPVKQDDTVARGYRRDVLVRWGDRVTFDAPAWDPRRPNPDGAAAQF